MAKQVKLSVEPRTALGRSAVRKLKATGIVPAIIYGAKDKPEALQVSRRDINAMLSHASGENILVELEMKGGKNRLALVQEVQHSPVGGSVLHIDFHAVSMDEVIQADVPLEPTGTSEWREELRRSARTKYSCARHRMFAQGFARCHQRRCFRA